MRDRRSAPFCYQTIGSLAALRRRFDGRAEAVGGKLSVTTALALYTVLTEIANEQRQRDGFTAMQRDIAERAGVSRQTVVRFLQAMVEAGVLEVEHTSQHGARTQNNYALVESELSDGPALSPQMTTTLSPQMTERVASDDSCNQEEKKKELTANAVNPHVAEDGDRPSPDQIKKPDEVQEIFDAWITATKRNPNQTKLTADRRRVIAKALKSHGFADCLAAVTNIGKDAWASGQNDRGTPFNYIKHALGSAERIERWRDWKPGKSTGRAGREALMMR